MSEAGEEPVLGFRIGVFNWRLKRAREAAGLTMQQLAEQAGIHLSKLYAVQGLREKPTEAQADRLASVLMIPIDDLFPGLIDGLVSRIGTVEVPLTETQVQALTTDDEDDRLRRITMQQVLIPALTGLTRRQQRILVDYTSVDRDDRPTAEVLGRELGLSREQVRQLEAAMLKRLRHPSIARRLVAALD